MTARRIDPPREAGRVTIEHDGQRIEAFEGEPLAAALLAAGISVLSRSAKYHRPRGSSCGSGNCSHCLVTIDGMPNRCACISPCSDGMVSRSQNVVGSAERDLLGITDWMFPDGLDHHEMFTNVPLVQPVVQRIVRRLSGLGEIAASGAEETGGVSSSRVEDGPRIDVDILVVGAGASGLAAAQAAAEEGFCVLLIEARDAPGGRLQSGIHGEPGRADDLLREATAAGAEFWAEAAAVRIDRIGGLLEVLALRPDRLVVIRTRALVLACGGYGATGIFENNDLPGIMTADWAGRLITRWGVLAGERPLICADEPSASSIRELFEQAGARPVRILPLSAAYAPVWPEPVTTRLVSAKGKRQVEKVVLETENGRETVACDLIVVATPPAPAFELALDAGARVAYEATSGGFAVLVDDENETAADDLFACGALTGPCTAQEAGRDGTVAGSAALARARRVRAKSPEGEETGHAS